MRNPDMPPSRPGATLLWLCLLLGPLAAPAQSSVAFVRQWGGSGSGNGQFHGTHALGFSPLFRIYVADEANHRIQYFAMEGTYLGQWGSWGYGTNEIINPVCLAFQADGTVYVVERDSNRIHFFSPNGAHRGMWGSAGTGNGQFNLPAAAAFAPQGDLYVTDRMNHRVQYFSPTGTYHGQFGSYGNGPGQFNEPYGVAVSSNAIVYVTDSQNCRVQYFTTNGTFLGTWGTVGSGDGQFGNTSAYNNGPGHLTIDRRGLIYVADPNNNRLEVFRANGQFVARHGSYGTGLGQFYFPNGLACAPGWQVYVADEGNSLVQQLTWLAGSDTNTQVAAIRTGPAVSIQVEAIPERTNGVQRATNLTGWATLEQAYRVNGLFWVTDAVPPAASAVFYRGISSP